MTMFGFHREYLAQRDTIHLSYSIVLGYFSPLYDILYSHGGISSWLRAHHLTQQLLATVTAVFIPKQQK